MQDNLESQPRNAPGPAGTTCWRAVTLSDLRWRFLEGQYVVYNSGSGHTHVLDPIAALMIQLTEERCQTTELVERVAAS
jgi:hypothetical protein